VEKGIEKVEDHVELRLGSTVDVAVVLVAVGTRVATSVDNPGA